MTRLVMLVILYSLLPAPLQAAEQDCPIYGLDPPLSLVNPPAMLREGFALTSYFGEFMHPTAAVLRFDGSGRLLWVRQLSGESSMLDWASGTGDGNLLVAGSARTSAGSGPVIAKLRPDGTMAWSRFLLGANVAVWGIDGARDGSGYATMWGGLAEVAKTQIGLVLRFTEDGGVAWARTITVRGDPIIQPVLAAQTDGVLIAKTWQVAFDKPLAILLIKLAQNGDLRWAHLISGGERDLGANNLLSLANDSFVVAGSAQDSGADGSDSALIHFDKDGNTLSASALHAPPIGNLRLISLDANDRLLVGGTTAQGGPTLADPVDPSQPTIARITIDGQVDWAKAEDFGARGGMLFGLAHGGDHMVAVGTRGDWGPATLLRLRPDGAPLGDGWSAATSAKLTSQKMDLTSAQIGVDLQSIALKAIDAELTPREATVKLVPLCSR